MIARALIAVTALAQLAHAQDAAPEELAPLGISQTTEVAVEPPAEPPPVEPNELAPLGVPTAPVVETAPAAPIATASQPAAVVPAPPSVPPWPPDPVLDVRVVLAGVATLATWGGGVALRIDASFIPIGDFSALGLGIDVMALIGYAAWGQSGLFRADAPVVLTATWRASLAPNVELGLRGGASVSLPYELLVGTSDYQLGIAVRGVGGAFTAFRVDRTIQMLIGLDVHFGAGELAAVSVGARI